MPEADDARDMAQPAPNPDAQTTVNDFLDYTEFFPSDLVRSLALIGDLDANYRDAVHHVHDLTGLYGQLPALPEQQRPDPALLRKQVAQYLQRAINQREYAYAEASRLYEVTVRHCQRSSIIKRKLQAQPEPPSRDPTPPPVSPSAQRSYIRNYERPPHLRLTFDCGRRGAGGARQRDHHRKPGALPSRRPRAHSASSGSSESDLDIRSNIDLAIPVRKHKQNRDRSSGWPRAPGVLGTNVHSSIAGISTSNALAQLIPPPPDAKPGSKWAPWLKLTEWEMAVLRKQMKKNAVWTPSLTMVNRELEKKHRTQGDYEREKARCEELGVEMLDEEPDSLQNLMNAEGLGQLASTAPLHEASEGMWDDSREDGGNMSIRLKPIAAKDGRKMDRLSQRQQAMRDALELENATSKLQQAADNLKELTFASHSVTTPASQKRKTLARPSNKRKRDATPLPATEDTLDTPREASVATSDSGSKQPEAKRPRLQDDITSPGPTQASAVSTPGDTLASAELSPAADTPVSLPEPQRHFSEGITVQVPLAPAGPSTPKPNKPLLRESSNSPTPQVSSPAVSSAAPDVADPIAPTAPAPTPAPAPSTATAASSRPRRESVAPKAASPPPVTDQALKSSKASTPANESVPEAPVHATRPRSACGHIPPPKAQSEEPKPNGIARLTRETRRHSIFSQSALTTPPQGTRMSTRKKLPPKGEVTAAEDGQKTVTNVKRAQGSKNKKKKKAEEESEAADEIDPDEEKYCICDDVSYGSMISCDNNCDREWFHLPCVHMTEKDIPSRRSKWYCPECRVSLGVDAYGNPLVPPPLPGRRGNGNR
ncbi:hypothetical protein BDU57DRAFT_514457 [Ampelomyces quisqualis]|uniref:PHD-type domain-containing protein n=1 Tax=Ampelomyces quisqualis TaxID=50730 RepID=A0A6A5QT11_AMPQU|nr:hypothetical protein BDU57DRAFT_514457 [Ampelomyces quisqualis]